MLERRENLDILTWLSCSDVDFFRINSAQAVLETWVFSPIGFGPLPLIFCRRVSHFGVLERSMFFNALLTNLFIIPSLSVIIR